MSRHRRRGPETRRASRQTGIAISLSAAAAVAAVIGGAAYLVGVRPGTAGTSGAAAAMAAVPASHSVAVLEQQRKQLIAMTAAAKTLSMVGKPKLASRQPASLTPAPAVQPSPASTASPGRSDVTLAGPPAAPPNPGSAQSIAWNMMPSFGFNPKIYFSCLNNIWTRESGWMWNAANPSGAYGIPQALPGSKMASAGPDWQTNPATQIKWGLGYIKAVYGNPCSAWGFWQAHDWY